MHIVDRRLNPGGKSLGNRQRFLKRVKAYVKRAVRDATRGRDVRGFDEGAEVTIPAHGVREPSFKRAVDEGVRDVVLPGNTRYVAGDRIDRPPSGSGGGGRQGSPTGEGQDDFRFALSRDEFLSLFLEDLELPDLAKRRVKGAQAFEMRRAGYSVTGSPANLALPRTMRQSLLRRLALSRPRAEAIAALTAEVDAEADLDVRAALAKRLEDMKRKARRVPFLDPLDLRYRRFETSPKPAAQAVMFCIMDVSGSMTEHMKDLAKRFFMLLHLFLTRRYAHVDIVFIRHTHEAKEVDEENFFHATETGGTLVSSALEEMKKILAQRYRPEDWNIYTAQASDGDNTASDSARTAALLVSDILPACQYYAYLEVGSEDGRMGFISHASEIWRSYEALRMAGHSIAMRRASHRREIYPVFRDLFRKREGVETAP